MAKYEQWLTAEGLLQLEAWARNGLTDEQIAANIGIQPSTLYEWKNKYPEVSESLKKGKEVIDIQVENALLKRALGYRYTEVTKELVLGEMITTKTVVKEVHPDTTAQIFWLKNRKPTEWRDKQSLEHSGKDGGPIQVETLTNTERQERIAELLAKRDSG